jgi:lysophospholipase L1-like esterase
MMIANSSIRLVVLFLSCWMPSVIFGEKPSTVIPVRSTLKKFMPKLHQEKLREAKIGKIDFVMIGDSITHAWSKYPSVFKWVNLLNLGFPGDRTQNVLWRIENGALDGISPKLVTLMIGTNNMHDSKKAYPADKPEDIFTGIKAIVTEVRTRLPKSKILVFSVFPRKAGPENERAKEVNAMLPEISDGKYISHHDLNAYFLNENGQQNKDLYNRDLLHLNDRGYLAWGRALYPLLKKHGLSVNPSVVGKND